MKKYLLNPSCEVQRMGIALSDGKPAKIKITVTEHGAMQPLHLTYRLDEVQCMFAVVSEELVNYRTFVRRPGRWPLHLEQETRKLQQLEKVHKFLEDTVLAFSQPIPA